MQSEMMEEEDTPIDPDLVIDVHAHIFPHQGSAAGYENVEENLANHKELLSHVWGQLKSNKTDPKYLPTRDEGVNFRVGNDGRFYWEKHGETVWLQRFPDVMKTPVWKPEHMIACMDSVGVDKAVLHAGKGWYGYMERHFCIEYFANAIETYPDRFLGTISTDYDITANEEYRQSELDMLRTVVRENGLQGVFQGYPRDQNPNDTTLDPFWETLVEYDLPHIFETGFRSRDAYLEEVNNVTALTERFPELKTLIIHLGGNLVPENHPEYAGTPEEWYSYLDAPNTYFELGYVLAFENRDRWGAAAEYPYPVHTDIAREIYENFGAGNLVWGTDMPMLYRHSTYQQCLDLVRVHCDFLSTDETEQVLGRNASRLFGLS